MARSVEGKKLINKLITETTGFHRSEENFGICQQYVTSNLRFHRYLDVDSHKVSLNLNGLYQKFDVHSETDTGNILKEKVSQFLNVHAFEKKDVAETDTHYAVLSFLSEMSNCPTSQSYQPSDDKPQAEAQVDDFDWYTYLTEDLDPLQSEFSDSTLDSEEDLDTELEAEVLCGPPVSSDDISKQVEVTTNTLREKLVVRYWAGEDNSTLHTNTDLAHNWVGHLAGLGDIEASQRDTYITEYQLVRETLWMIAGATSTYLYSFDEDSQTFCIKPGVNLTHTTKPTLTNALSKLSNFGTELQQLRQFVSKFMRGDYASLNCRTYQAFCVAISQLIDTVDRFTTQITQQIKSEVVSATIMNMIQQYKDKAQMIQLVHSIYKSAILPVLGLEQAVVSSAATYLLSACNSAVNNVSIQCTDHNTVLTIAKVFIRTLEPYLTIIDQWLTDGNLNDPYLEFVVRKKNTECLDETFWDSAVEVTSLELDEVDSPRDSFTFSRSVPDLLEGTLFKIATTGKSMEMLSRLGKLNLALGTHDRSLHSVFIDKLCQALSWTGDIVDSARDALTTQTSDVAPVIDSTVNKLEKQAGINPLLLANLRALFEPMKPFLPGDELGSLSQLNTDNMMSISKAMTCSLGDLINIRYTQVSQCLLGVLKTECRLEHYLSLIRKVFLLEAGDIMYGFWWELFDKIRHTEDWKDALTLNISIQESLEKAFPKDMYRFNLSLNDIQKSELLPIHMLEELNLHYEVDWPIDVVYNSECEADYNRIFQFLLQLKLAKYSIDHLSFEELLRAPIHVEGDPSPEERTDEETHQLEQVIYLLRMQLLHFVNAFHDYTMTMILHSARVTFESKLEKAEDLETIIRLHRVYLNQIYDRCFLHENNSALHDCLLKILNCALKFQRMWDSSLRLIREAEIEEINREFHRCLYLLSSCITTTTKTGSLPHLESLSQTLKTLTQ